MRTVFTRQKLIDICECGLLCAPALILMLASLFGSFTPALDKLPSEFGAVARMAAAAAGLFMVVISGTKEHALKKIAVFVIAAAGLMIMLETGVTLILDAALILLLVVTARPKVTAWTVFAFFSCLTGATFILAFKGAARVYNFYGINALGFRSLTGLFTSLGLIIVSALVLVFIFTREKQFKSIALHAVYPVLLSALLILFAVKAVNLSAAVEQGSYELYSRDTDMGVEVRMKGFDDYLIDLGSDEATLFSIVPDGDYYQITMDSYGITKTLCVIEGGLYAGNYDQSQAAHIWDIKTVSGTPYFTIRNVESGLWVAVSENGGIELVSGDAGESGFFRIGSENIDYYEKLSSDVKPSNDLGEAQVTVSPTAAYTGASVRPAEITVELNGVVLQEGRDYQVECWNNYLPGTAWVDVTGTGDYEGTTGASFEIIYADDVCDDPFYRDTADYVVRVYRMAYMRYPTVAEVKDYVLRLIGDNRTPDSVIWEVYGEGGFNGTNAQLIEAIYRLMLLRNGSRGELAGWIAELDSGASREDVINAISESPDYQNIWHSFGIGYR